MIVGEKAKVFGLSAIIMYSSYLLLFFNTPLRFRMRQFSAGKRKTRMLLNSCGERRKNLYIHTTQSYYFFDVSVIYGVSLPKGRLLTNLSHNFNMSAVYSSSQ